MSDEEGKVVTLGGEDYEEKKRQEEENKFDIEAMFESVREENPDEIIVVTRKRTRSGHSTSVWSNIDDVLLAFGLMERGKDTMKDSIGESLG